MSRARADRMASVLRVRKVQEDIAAGHRMVAEHARTAEETRMAARQDDVRRPWGARVLTDLSYEAVGRARVDLDAATDVAAARRVDHIAAVQRARAIERLVERRRAEAAAEAARKAAAVLDDLSNTRYLRRQAKAAAR